MLRTFDNDFTFSCADLVIAVPHFFVIDCIHNRGAAFLKCSKGSVPYLKFRGEGINCGIIEEYQNISVLIRDIPVGFVLSVLLRLLPV
jgi:hypothetical protein